ncbi:putative serine hydrolase [Caerostris extrusa]|uniref:Serine hydrolase n=1 Tax=Caerostris extrusa TaxID=172846 RepID=A0AAV4VTN1_CAEEX|nr:putative serine hydrolase [Caerostris extrusa]
MQTIIKELIQFERKLSKPAPVYSPEIIRKRLVDGLYNQVKPEYIDCLLKRGSQPSKCGKGVVFSRDIRLQIESSFRKLSHDTLMGYLKIYIVIY